jgi:predicted kinase
MTPLTGGILAALLVLGGVAVAVALLRKKREATESVAAPVRVCHTEIVTWAQLVEHLTEAPNTKRLVIACGVQGSGKSTFAKLLVAAGYERVCLDKMLKHQPWIIYELDSHYWSVLKGHFRKGVNVVDDNLNLDLARRAELIKYARKWGYTDVTIVHMDTPLDVCIYRNEHREGRHVKEEDIRASWERLNNGGRPNPDEAKLIRVEPTKDDDVNLQRCQFCE